MSVPAKPAGRRERNKQAKFERIIAAAGELFAERGVEEVTTQEIADRADVATGTLFLYARTKGELLLLVQNGRYAVALVDGRTAAERIFDVQGAVLAIVRPIVECNRSQIDNGRTYLREIVFGDPAEPGHAEALTIVAQTEQLIASVLCRDSRVSERDALNLAHVLSAIMFVSLASSINADLTIEQMMHEITALIAVLLRR